MLSKEELLTICLGHPEFFQPCGIDLLDEKYFDHIKDESIKTEYIFIDFIKDNSDNSIELQAEPLTYLEDKPLFELWVEINTNRNSFTNDKYETYFTFSICIWGIKDDSFTSVLEIEYIPNDLNMVKEIINFFNQNGFNPVKKENKFFIIIGSNEFYVDARLK